MYDEFVREVRRMGNLGNVASVLQWDQEVVMPDGGTEARSQQLSTLSTAVHERLTSDRMRELLEELDPEDPGRRAAVREVRREHERSVRVPEKLVETISKKSSEAFPVWRRAKEEDDFDLFAPVLEELVELKQRYAEYVEPGADPYRVLFEDFEPYIDIGRAERVIDDMREGLAPLIEARAEKPVPENPLDGDFSEERQMEMVRGALETLGFDFERGRLDTSPHPFSTGNQFDARITTRFGDDPLDALTSTVHEFGHALYTLGLPEEHYATPLGQARELTVHESQSRLWENHVARSGEFWKFFTPRLNSALGTDALPHEVHRYVNRVDPGPIRVESDELTYHAHIALRFEIESGLVRNEVSVDEVPGLWNDGMERHLGVRPETDAEGCLQDVHWSHGSFGYFPTYSLGSALAAQTFDAARDDLPELDRRIAEGDFGPLREWLKEEVHRHGQRYTTDELVERSTGEPLSAEPFLEYAEEKYGVG